MKTKKLLGIVLMLLLAACGGGGGTTEPPPITPPITPPAPPVEPATQTFNMDAAYATALSTGVSSGWMPETGSLGRRLAVSYQPVTDGEFLGQTFRRSLMRISSLQPPSATSGSLVSSPTIFYSLGPTVIAGQFDAQGRLTRYLGLGNLPTAAAVGQSGPYARALIYAGPTEQELLREQLVSWSIEADTAATAWACLTFTNTDGAVAEEDCLRIDATGAVSGFKMAVPWGGATLVTYQDTHVAAAQPLAYTLLDDRFLQMQAAETSLITDQPGWRSYWFAHALVSSPALPIDFSTQRVAAMALGARPTGCWNASLVSVEEWPDRIAVRYRETLWPQACTQALVYPALLAAIPRSGEKPVQWVALPTAEPTAGDHAPAALVTASYDPPATGFCRVLRFTATLPAGPGASASDLSELGFTLLDANGTARAASWDGMQVSMGQGFYRIEGAGCPTSPAPHGSLWPLFTLKLNGVQHEFFAPATTPADSSTLAFDILGSVIVGWMPAPQFLTMTDQAAFASYWTSYRATPVPTVDFSREMVGAILLPETDNCHRVEVDAIVEWPDRIEVEYGDRWIPGMVCAAVLIPSGAGTVFTMPLSAKPFQWLRQP